MKKAIIIALLITQAHSMSFYDVFAPVEDSLGRLVSDVVSDIRETIDCTILAVERVFTLGGIFGGPSEYDQRCRGQNADNVVPNDVTSSADNDTPATPEENAPKVTATKEIIQDVSESVSDASLQIQDILDQSNTRSKIENVQHTIKNESDRLNQISALLSHELGKLPDEVKKKFNFNFNRSTKLEDIFDEIKLLYEAEQRDRSSAEANEVRHVFDKVLIILRCTGIDGSLSDEDQVKLILKLLGKSSNDIEKQVAMWTDEENKNIKNIVIITNDATQTLSNNNSDKDKSKEHLLLTEKLDEIETQQSRMVDFSKSLNDLNKNILDQVSSIGSPKPGIEQYITVSPVSSNKLKEHENVSVSSEKEEQSFHPTTESSATMETYSLSTESSVPAESPQEKDSLSFTSTGISTITETISVSPQEKDSPAATTTEFSINTKSVSTESTFVNNVTAPSSTEFSTSTENIPVSASSPRSNQTLFQTSAQLSYVEEERNSEFTESHTEVNDNAFTSAAPLTTFITTTMKPTNQENSSTAQSPLMISHRSTESNQLLQSNTQTNTTTKFSSNIIKRSSTLQSSETSSSSVRTLQSNIQKATTATQSTASNAQQLEAVSQENRATPNTPQADSQEYVSTTPTTNTAYQPNTATDLPKTFKQLAQKVFTNKNPPEYQDYDYAYPDSTAEGGKTDSLALLNKLFGPQDPASQQEAVASAKNLVEESKRTNALLNKLFQNTDRSSAPSVFDEYDY